MFIPNDKIKVGDNVISIRTLSNFNGTFTTGHKFKVAFIGLRGYSLEDEDGNMIIETGWDSVKKDKANEKAV